MGVTVTFAAPTRGAVGRCAPWLNGIEAQFRALRFMTLAGTETPDPSRGPLHLPIELQARVRLLVERAEYLAGPVRLSACQDHA